MSSPVISVRGLGKKYRLGETIRHDTLRDKIAHSLKTLFAKKENSEARSAKREAHPNLPSAPRSALRAPESSPVPRSAFRVPSSADFWALKDVSFDVQQGEVVGIIGRNGAGKSTLLKILSQITEPTEGEIRMRGRVASLLEVGTGFHPELTGRENIYLNGAILGMTRAEIKSKFDEIVAFSEIEKFLDTPVKRYSSGMYVRLAFAVAAHLEPEILIVDEVLAVGDYEFQKKCLGKMEDVAKYGRTVLFVSHNINAITTLCRKGVLLREGRIQEQGEIARVVKCYTAHAHQLSSVYLAPEGPVRGKLQINSVVLLKNGVPEVTYCNSETMIIRIEYAVYANISGCQIAFELLNEDEECILSSTSQDGDGVKELYKPGRFAVECSLALSMLRDGQYYVKVTSSVPGVEILDDSPASLRFQVVDDSSPIIRLGQNRRGIILPIIPWRKAIP